MPFDTTVEARDVTGILGQERAAEAVRFGIGIRQPRYNLFAIGPEGVGKQTLLRQLLDQQAAGEPPSSDWCYVHDFAHLEHPHVLELPPGKGRQLERDLARAVRELRVAMRAAFESEEYRTQKQRLLERLKEQQERALQELRDRARLRDVAVLQSDAGLAIAPVRDGDAVDAAKFSELPKDQQERLQAGVERVREDLQAMFQKFRGWEREHQEAHKALDRQIAIEVARRVLDGVRSGYAGLPEVLEHLEQVELNVIDSADEFLEAGSEGLEARLTRALEREQDGASFRRYEINVLVASSGAGGAPVVYEDNPTYGNLIGRIEYETQFGALITNFTLIKAGAFHRANGGYLILDALRVLQSPFSWDAVKRTIRSNQVRIESLGQVLGLVSTVSLEPAPVPLRRLKVVLVGERVLYYLLAALDPDFLELFKVLVDFEERVDRRPETQELYANLVATLVKKRGLRPFDRTAVDDAGRFAVDSINARVEARLVSFAQTARSFLARPPPP